MIPIGKSVSPAGKRNSFLGKEDAPRQEYFDKHLVFGEYTCETARLQSKEK